VGDYGVMVFEPKGMKVNAADGFRDMRIHLLRRGQSLDLVTRKPLP